MEQDLQYDQNGEIIKVRELELFRIIMSVIENYDLAGGCVVLDYIIEFMPKKFQVCGEAIRNENKVIKKKMLMISLCHNIINEATIKMNEEVSEATKKVMLECNHQYYIYHPDASGNNDCWYECSECGKSLNRKQRENSIRK